MHFLPPQSASVGISPSVIVHALGDIPTAIQAKHAAGWLIVFQIKSLMKPGRDQTSPMSGCR